MQEGRGPSEDFIGTAVRRFQPPEHNKSEHRSGEMHVTVDFGSQRG